MSRRGTLLFAAMCVIWGVPYLMIRVAVRELAPVTLVCLRTAIAALILLPVAAARGELRPLARRWAAVVVFSAIEIGVPWLLLARAETKLTSSLTGLLVAAVPLVGAVVTAATGARERHGARRWLGLVVGLAGVAALVGLDLHGAAVVPLVELAVVAVGYAVGPIILARRLADAPPTGVVAASLTVAAIAYAPFAAFSLPPALPEASVVWSVFGLAVLCTAVAFLLFFALIAEVGPVRATVITYVNPAVAAVLGVSVLGESFTGGMAVGFVLVLAGSVLATAPSREAAGRSARGLPESA
ncbi:MAG TPA: EamA family transporter [Gaiellaceae bacterium]|nr:EamA family transporter [Gaiellaceae bacterium]